MAELRSRPRRIASISPIGSLLGFALVAFGALVAKADAPVAPDHAAKMTQGLALFQSQVRSLLLQNCFKCHGGESVESGFNMTDRDGLLKGGDAGVVVVAGKSHESLLYKLITHAKKPHMPSEAPKLPADAVARIAEWIDLGAPYDNPLKAVAGTSVAGAAWTEKELPAAARKFWSFQPLHSVEPPVVKNVGWCRTPIDRFILAKMEAAGVAPNPQASKPQLIRRLYFDLVGLPPTPEEIAAFVADPAPDAYEKIVDRLLANPRFGERWARRWLDLARFAESGGFERDFDRPNAYLYRDFVIRAINDDLPYDTFVRWQLAGDELDPENPQANEATGFLAAGVHSDQITKSEVERHRYDEMDDMLSTTGTAMLGLTIGCARCHDHKYDPILQRDYYRMLSAFTTTVRSETDLTEHLDQYRREKKTFDRDHESLVAALRKYEAEKQPARFAEWDNDRLRIAIRRGAPPELLGPSISESIVAAAALPAQKRSPKQTAALMAWYRTIDPEWQKLNRAVQDHLAKAPKQQTTRALVASEGLSPLIAGKTQGDLFFQQTYFLSRGDGSKKAGVAPMGVLQVLDTAPEKEKHWRTQPPPGWRTSYRRRALAGWITDSKYGAGGLLARVEVNRLWQFHMGRGIVATPSDFGARGERPTHPELLDWLAAQFIAGGWKPKAIHRMILTSAAYMQSSAMNDADAKVDSDDRTFWRRPTQRLEAEVIRDSLLAVGNRLDPTMFGKSTLDPASRRRSIYLTVKRSKLIPMLTVFDGPDALGGIGSRGTTTVAPQSLYLLNNDQVRECAIAMATRIAPRPQTSLETAVNAGYQVALGRSPTDGETADSLDFLKLQIASYQKSGKPDARQLALADFCQALMCLNEFVYVD